MKIMIVKCSIPVEITTLWALTSILTKYGCMISSLSSLSSVFSLSALQHQRPYLYPQKEEWYEKMFVNFWSLFAPQPWGLIPLSSRVKAIWIKFAMCTIHVCTSKPETHTSIFKKKSYMTKCSLGVRSLFAPQPWGSYLYPHEVKLYE